MRETTGSAGQDGARLAAQAESCAADIAAPLSAQELRRVERGQRRLAFLDARGLLALAQSLTRPLNRMDVLRAHAVRREVAARAGTTWEQVLRYVDASPVLSVRTQGRGVEGSDDWTIQVRNSRYPGTEHSAGLRFGTRAGRWRNASGQPIPDEHVLAYLYAYEQDPTRHPMSMLQEIAGP